MDGPERTEQRSVWRLPCSSPTPVLPWCACDHGRIVVRAGTEDSTPGSPCRQRDCAMRGGGRGNPKLALSANGSLVVRGAESAGVIPDRRIIPRRSLSARLALLRATSNDLVVQIIPATWTTLLAAISGGSRERRSERAVSVPFVSGPPVPYVAGVSEPGLALVRLTSTGRGHGLLPGVSATGQLQAGTVIIPSAHWADLALSRERQGLAAPLRIIRQSG
jgi:hypothetical protein